MTEEDRRYELAKDIMLERFRLNNNTPLTFEDTGREAVMFADALLLALEEKKC